MPVPLAAAGIVAGLASSAGSIIVGNKTNKRNIEFQKEQNKLDRQFQQEMYLRQRMDNLKDWNAQNAYNSPLQQMQRLREAGLNPHLVYGQGAQSTAAMIKSSSPSGGNQPAPQSDTRYFGEAMNSLANSITNGAQLRIMQAQANNLDAQNALLIKEGYIKDADLAGKLIGNARSDFDLSQALRLKDITVDQAIADLRKTNTEIQKIATDIQFTLDANDRAEVANSANVALTLQKILQSKADTAKSEAERERILVMIELAKNQEQINSYAAKLAENGYDPNSPWYWREMNSLFIRLADGLSSGSGRGSYLASLAPPIPIATQFDIRQSRAKYKNPYNLDFTRTVKNGWSR